MTTMGVLAVAILASLLLALLDMNVYREAFGSALYRQTPAYIGWQTYFMVIAAFIVALFRDLRIQKRVPKASSSEQHGKRIKR